MIRFIFLSVFILFSVVTVQSQVPQSLNYQAIARTNAGVIIPAQNIGVRFSILEGAASGPILYEETHQTQTNNFGLFILQIGKGTPASGSFVGINWGSGTDKFLKVEIAPSGGSNYQLQGTSQLVSVPYALFAEKTRLIAGNNTVSITNNNTISGNYQPGTGINISGNVISHNLVAGSGISISANTISSTGNNSHWTSVTNGIRNISGNVGIGMDPHPIVPLIINQPNSGVGWAVLQLRSDDIWHTALTMFNNPTPNSHYSLIIGGPINTDVPQGNFAIVNHSAVATPYVLMATRNTNMVGIGSGTPTTLPRSRLHIFNGDINIEQIGSGIILKSPDGQCWRITIDNLGNLVRTAIACP